MPPCLEAAGLQKLGGGDICELSQVVTWMDEISMFLSTGLHISTFPSQTPVP